jgi:hypothetical protein
MRGSFALGSMYLQGLLDDVGEIRAAGVVAAAVEHRAAEMSEFIGEGGAHAIAQIAIRKNDDALHLALAREMACETASFILGR